MIRKQVFIRDDQNKKLKSLTTKLGVSEAELIREGIDKMLEEKTAANEDWKQGILQAAGIWKDRDDLDKQSQTFRQNWNRRFTNSDVENEQ